MSKIDKYDYGRSVDHDAKSDRVELQSGMSFLMCSEIPEGLEISSGSILKTDCQRQLCKMLETPLAIGGLALKVTELSQDTLQLTPETRAIMEREGGRLMKSGGRLLGVIVNDRNQIIGQARFVMQSGFTGVGGLATVLAQVPIILLLIKCEKLSENVNRTNEKLDKILARMDEKENAQLSGLKESLKGLIKKAEYFGCVDEKMMYDIPQSNLVEECKTMYIDRIHTHIGGLTGRPEEVRTYIDEKYGSIVSDFQSLLTILWVSTWRAYLIMNKRPGDDVEPGQYSENYKRESEDFWLKYKEAEQYVVDLYCKIMKSLELFVARSVLSRPGREKVKSIFSGSRSKYIDPVEKAKGIIDLMGPLQDQFGISLSKPYSVRIISDKEVSGQVCEILKWMLPEGDRPIFLVYAKIAAIDPADSSHSISYSWRPKRDFKFLLVTQRNLYCVMEDDLFQGEHISDGIPLRDIRFVRLLPIKGQGPLLKIFTRNEDFEVDFGKLSADGGLDSACGLTELLRAEMNIPEEERRTDPRLEVTPPDREPEEIGAPDFIPDATGMADPV
ncbi:hypothetical protein M0E82_08420 [Corynebacterium sp. P7202]|uniref:Uncharacterized protein n=1 Tax=Corynebacterium pygosceleis TaxID=2800406 RepID=A0A9Q4C884_9CORY|nr:hypothetical protein [Corynebacterium pygosceleis]MCK7638018.1 hypothetical protein [Corynebacterium pygosceleis]MCX7468734.1 hypothetical protein [Corynebacterium pygosceleis]